MGERVLVTGASGFLGGIISKELIKSGYQLFTLGKQKTNNLQVDLTSGAFKIPPAEKIDVVIHSAGKAHSVPRTQQEIKAFYDVNFEGTKNLCNAIISSGFVPKAFIFISTVAVYGVDFGELITEDHPLDGNTPYALSKILAENWLQTWASENKVSLSILRLPLVVGPNPPGNLGAMIKGIKSGRYLSIGKADARKSMVWAADVASVIPQLINKGGIYNLTDGFHPSFNELELCIAGALRKSQPLKIPLVIAKVIAFFGNFLGTRSPINSDKLKKIISTLTFDDTRARTMLGWHPGSILEKLPRVI